MDILPAKIASKGSRVWNTRTVFQLPKKSSLFPVDVLGWNIHMHFIYFYQVASGKSENKHYAINLCFCLGLN